MPYKDIVKRKAYASKWQKDNPRKEEPEQKRIRNLKLRYGISVEDYDAMFIEQDGKCAICGRESTDKCLCVDHNHKTGKVRGLLCQRCNALLGLLENHPEMLVQVQNFLFL